MVGPIELRKALEELVQLLLEGRQVRGLGPRRAA
jgi:hypothetical protein